MNEAIRLMAEKRIRRIPVTDNGDLLGIVTIHDVIGRIIAPSGLDIEIKDIMAKTITAVWQDTPMTVLRKVLSLARIKAVPVLDDFAKMVGMVGLDDIISLSEEVSSSSTSSGTATGEFHTGSWDAMDVIKIEQKLLSVPNVPVKDIMTSSVVTAFESASAAEIAQKMRRHNFSQLPVVNAQGDLIGMIYDRQILAAYAQTML
jgi:CBS domain-containing protein